MQNRLLDRAKGSEEMKMEMSMQDLMLQKEEGYRWLARKKDGWLFTFEECPTKKDGDWNTDFDIAHEAVESYISNFYSTIESEDDEPTHLPTFLQLKQKEEVKK